MQNFNKPMVIAGLLFTGLFHDPHVAVAARGFPLVVDHQSAAVVVRPAGALKASGRGLERMAVEDLVNYVEKSTGAKLTVTASAREVAADRPVVVLAFVGSAPEDAAAKPSEPLKRHAFYFDVTDRRMTILGADPRGLVSGVHWFLRNKLGVRWYMPTELGEEVPRHASLVLQPEQTIVNPEFEWIRFTTNHNGEGVWGVRHGDSMWDKDFRDNWHFQMYWQYLLPLTPENVENHPEWWEREEGQLPKYHRELNVCVSNPEVLARFVEAGRRYFDARPSRVMLSLEPNDGPNYCKCKSCQSLKAGLGSGATMSDVFVFFCNQVVAEVSKTHPDKLFGFYAYVAYGDHTYPPTNVKPDPRLRVLMTRYGNKVCNRHWLEDPRCQVNPKWYENFSNWSRALGNCGIYDYWAGYQWFGPEPHTRLSKDLPLFKKLGVQYINSESGYSWGTMAPFYYQTACLLQDTSLDGDELIDEFCRGMYGPAYAPMHRYWRGWIDAFDTGPAVETYAGHRWLPAHISWHIYKYHYDQVYTPDVIAAAYKNIDEALGLVNDVPQRYRTRIQMAQYALRYTEQILAMYRHIAARDFLQACEPAERAIEIIKESRTLPPGPDTFVNHETDAAYRVGVEIGHIKRVHQEHLAKSKVSAGDSGPTP